MTKRRKSSSVRVLLEANEYDNYGIGDISYALVTLSAVAIRKLLKLMDEVKRRKDIDYIATYDYSPYWLGQCRDTIRKGLNGEDIDDAATVDCEMREVNDSRVYWRATYKHTSCNIESRGLYRENLEDLLKLARGEVSADDAGFIEQNGELLNLDLIRDIESSTA